MPRTREQPDREERILNEIVVDAYGRSERALAWYYYLQDNLQFPLMAQCRQKRSISPLKVGETMQVVGMADEDDCMSEVFVFVKYARSKLGVPLSQLECQTNDEPARQAISDWHYWVARGYEY
jgi:hypothetical protein